MRIAFAHQNNLRDAYWFSILKQPEPGHKKRRDYPPFILIIF
jgi:hypothetical protein